MSLRVQGGSAYGWLLLNLDLRFPLIPTCDRLILVMKVFSHPTGSFSLHGMKSSVQGVVGLFRGRPGFCLFSDSSCISFFESGAARSTTGSIDPSLLRCVRRRCSRSLFFAVVGRPDMERLVGGLGLSVAHRVIWGREAMVDFLLSAKTTCRLRKFVPLSVPWPNLARMFLEIGCLAVTFASDSASTHFVKYSVAATQQELVERALLEPPPADHIASGKAPNRVPSFLVAWAENYPFSRKFRISVNQGAPCRCSACTIPAPHPRSREILLIAFPALGSLFPFIPCLGEYECLSPGLLRFPGGKKVIASSLNEYALGPQEDHLSLSIQRSETASSVGDIGSPSLLSYLSHPGWALA
ncbi:hypothetical protein V6N11_055116 [Hibiscus sabdariffa]|uniref:Uncharacterized protein n=1 Tax=Hibiscus sabdariffa TaxID=183260 RepID=A0ABR1ZQ12_9ROSI